MSVAIMKGKIGFNDIMRIIMFNLSLINADRFHIVLRLNAVDNEVKALHSYRGLVLQA